MRVRIKGIWYDAESTPILVELNKNDKMNIREMPDEHQNYITFPEHMDLDDAITDLGLQFEGGKISETQIEETNRDGSVTIDTEES